VHSIFVGKGCVGRNLLRLAVPFPETFEGRSCLTSASHQAG
jgi:hypothetical protein